MLADKHGFAVVTDALARLVEDADLVAGIDARGFLLGGAVAHRLGVGVLAIRKGGKLPPPVHSRTYTLEYGSATLEIPADALHLTGRKVAIVDDVLATGGTLRGARSAPHRRRRRGSGRRGHAELTALVAGTCSPRFQCTACSAFRQSQRISSDHGSEVNVTQDVGDAPELSSSSRGFPIRRILILRWLPIRKPASRWFRWLLTRGNRVRKPPIHLRRI